MIKRLFLPVIAFILCFSVLSYGQSQISLSGVIDDNFEKDFRNTPFPRDKNANIITEKELLIKKIFKWSLLIMLKEI